MEDKEAAEALFKAVSQPGDEYGRYRAFVLLTGFDDPRLADLARAALKDRNGRLREAAYAWLERNPDPALTGTLLAALDAEQGEFVRPALLRAVAALDANERVRTMLTLEVSRGLDMYRSAVIEVLGERRAAYAVDAIAPAASQEGPLQDDAATALGRIGNAKAIEVLASLTTKDAVLRQQIATALCLANNECAAQRARLARELTAPTSADAMRSAAAGLTLLAVRGDTEALAALAAAGGAASGDARVRAAIGAAFVALKSPGPFVTWLVGQPPGARPGIMAMLHEAFDRLEADLDEESFFASIRAAYWQAPEGSEIRNVAAALIDTLEF